MVLFGEFDEGSFGGDVRVAILVFSFYYLLIYAVLAGFMMWSESLYRIEESRALAAREAVLRAEAEAKAVRAQFNPHFVFNTLHSLMLLVRADPTAAERAIEDVAALIRYAASLDRRDLDAVRLGDEVEIAERYMGLEALRLADRLRVRWEVEPDLESAGVPPLSLQILLENAIKHGISPKPEGGCITIRVRRDSDHLLISVEDDGLGAEPETVRAAEGKGLNLLRRRLSMAFGDSASLTWRTSPGGGFVASLRVPRVTIVNSPDGGPIRTSGGLAQ
jgi:LytS/YehU family sensor histidine kinase